MSIHYLTPWNIRITINLSAGIHCRPCWGICHLPKQMGLGRQKTGLLKMKICKKWKYEMQIEQDSGKKVSCASLSKYWLMGKFHNVSSFRKNLVGMFKTLLYRVVPNKHSWLMSYTVLCITLLHLSFRTSTNWVITSKYYCDHSVWYNFKLILSLRPEWGGYIH